MLICERRKPASKILGPLMSQFTLKSKACVAYVCVFFFFVLLILNCHYGKGDLPVHSVTCLLVTDVLTWYKFRVKNKSLKTLLSFS